MLLQAVAMLVVTLGYGTVCLFPQQGCYSSVAVNERGAY